MDHTYTVYPPHHQPQWPANDNEPEPSLLFKLLMALGAAVCILLLVEAVLGGLLEMAGGK